jgi:hypothetical protein
MSGGRRIVVIADDYVDREFGTGALKITPGGSPAPARPAGAAGPFRALPPCRPACMPARRIASRRPAARAACSLDTRPRPPILARPPRPRPQRL